VIGPWFVSWPALWPSESGTVSLVSSETSPDGLAVNAFTRSGASLGKSWITNANTLQEARVTLASPLTPTLVFAAGADWTAAATVQLRGEPGSVLLATLSKLRPGFWAALIVGAGSYSAFTFRASDAGHPTGDLEVPFVAFGTGHTLPGYLRPARRYQVVDPSELSVSRIGAKFALKQRQQLSLGLSIYAHSDDSDVATLRGMIETVGVTEPIFCALDTADLTRYGETIVGALERVPAEQIPAGLMASFSLDLLEIVV